MDKRGRWERGQMEEGVMCDEDEAVGKKERKSGEMGRQGKNGQNFRSKQRCNESMPVVCALV